MENMEFRKFLTEYSISIEEYENMADEEKQKLLNKFNHKEKTENLNKIGDGIKGCGCLIMLVPILLILLLLLFTFIKSII